MKNRTKQRHALRIKRARRIRARIAAVSDRPRLSVFRSLKHISGQIIDRSGKILAAASDAHLKTTKKQPGVATAKAVGKLLAERALAKKISLVVFDKGSYTYHGRVKALADGAREGGLQL